MKEQGAGEKGEDPKRASKPRPLQSAFLTAEKIAIEFNALGTEKTSVTKKEGTWNSIHLT